MSSGGWVGSDGRWSPGGLSRLLTVDEAAAWLQVKPRTIYQWFHWVQQGYIPVINLGALVRFDHAGIAAWLRERELPGRARQKVEFDVV